MSRFAKFIICGSAAFLVMPATAFAQQSGGAQAGGSGKSPAAVAPEKSAKAFGSRTLKKNMRGPDVRAAQQKLSRIGVKIRVNGHFGRTTVQGVRRFEKRAKRPVDGVLDKHDAKALADLEQGAPAESLVSESTSDAVRRGLASFPGGAAPTPVGSLPEPPAKATIDPATGDAKAPAGAPEPIKQMVEAGNEIKSKPYLWGGGHGRLHDSGYDCSGSSSFLIIKAGLMQQALDSSAFMSWGVEGPGVWFTVLTNPSHAFMYVAGLRFDTSSFKSNGKSRWSTAPRPGGNFTMRHFPGL